MRGEARMYLNWSTKLYREALANHGEIQIHECSLMNTGVLLNIILIHNFVFATISSFIP